MPSSYAVTTSSPSDTLSVSRNAASTPSITPAPATPRPGSSTSSTDGYHRSARLPTVGGGRVNSPNYSYRAVNNGKVQPHITSAIARAYSPPVPVPATAAPERPPRTSSLLPPPRIIPNYASVQPDAVKPPLDLNGSSLTISSVPEAANPRDPKHSRKSSGPFTHSRSSSLGGLTDSLRTLNRWSSSTASSRVSPQRSGRYSRRVSVDFLGQTGADSRSNSPNKPQKTSRPSTSGGSPRAGKALPTRRSSLTARLPPVTSLPPIRALSPLQHELDNESASRTDTPSSFTAHANIEDDDAGYFRDVFKRPANQFSLAVQITSNGNSTPAAESPQVSAMASSHNGEAKGHSRSRSQTANGSSDTTGSSRSRDRSRQPSQKAMLARALQKANQAVQLDNARSYEVARDSYEEACVILQQVLSKTPGEDDRGKLEAIRKTYANRVVELDALIPNGATEQKALPARPKSEENYPVSFAATDSGEDDAVVEIATVTRIQRDPGPDRPPPPVPNTSVPSHIIKRPATSSGAQSSEEITPRAGQPNFAGAPYPLQPRSSRQPQRLDVDLALRPPIPIDYMPPPLSPRRPPSRSKAAGRSSPDRSAVPDFSIPSRANTREVVAEERPRDMSQETTSWLDPIESGGSSSSSVHSRTSSLRVKRKHIRAASGNTEAEFDAALDDAIEAAYNDGYEPEDDRNAALGNDSETDPEESIAKALRKVEVARQRVRESEREAMELANERERRLRAQLQLEEDVALGADGLTRDEGNGDGNESEEEERMLEEMTKGYVIEDFSFGSKTKRAVPRESDSSGFTNRTWNSSLGSNPPTASTVLSTLSEATVTAGLAKNSKPPLPPPTVALPPHPGAPRTAASPNRQSVRNRRLSGQNAKQLKIETTKLGQPSQPVTAVLTNATASAQAQGQQRQPQAQQPPQQVPKTAGYIVQQRQALTGGVSKPPPPMSARTGPSPVSGISSQDGTPSTPSLPQVNFPEIDMRAGSPSKFKPMLRKNMSSTSLRSTKSRNLSVSAGDDTSDLSPGTPMSAHVGSANRIPALPTLPSSMAAAQKGSAQPATTGGLHLFDMGFHSPTTPGSPDPMATEAPVPLEPCPTDTMLRPFWLMRCLYQTLAHPRGGYLSTRLFVPRDAWRERGVKLKGVDDKIAQCDLLTAALQRLARVDTFDADAVLEEMQALEGVLEQVQAALSRRLGNGEVGVQGSSALFKDASSGLDVEAVGGSGVPRSASVAGSGAKAAGGSGFSWRRLKSKGSSVGLSAPGGGSKATTPIDGPGSATALVGGGKEIILPTLPMTSNPTSKPSRRDIGSANFSGPNATYMAALARLFDAAQMIDQIARQVDDPGLRHADKTQVGLELCTRHAAEFFAFYICRFVLSDLSMLLDKYVKRASEWVLS